MPNICCFFSYISLYIEFLGVLDCWLDKSSTHEDYIHNPSPYFPIRSFDLSWRPSAHVSNLLAAAEKSALSPFMQHRKAAKPKELMFWIDLGCVCVCRHLDVMAIRFDVPMMQSYRAVLCGGSAVVHNLEHVQLQMQRAKRAKWSWIAAQLKARLSHICPSAPSVRLSCPISSLFMQLPLCFLVYIRWQKQADKCDTRWI